MTSVSVQPTARAAAPGLAVSCAGSVAVGDCFGGAVCGWNALGAVLTVRNAGNAAWRLLRAAVDLCVTVTARLRQVAVQFRNVLRRALFLHLKPKALELASCLVMRR